MHKLERLVLDSIQPLNATHFFVGCSGGMDSTVLVHCLHKLGKRVSMVHVNYQLRGEESEGDQQFLEDFAQERNIPFHVKRVRLATILEEKKGNLQEEARKIRRDYLKRFALKDSMYVAFAHHADDQVETFLFNLARGGGLLGLCAMLPIHQRIVRPLLGVSRDEIKAYAQTEKLNWREDSSNHSMKYTRNRIRKEWLPLIKSQIPDFDTHVRTLITQFQAQQLLLEQQVQPLILRIKQQNRLTIQSYKALVEEQKVVLLRGLSIPLSMITQFDHLVAAEKGKYLILQHPIYTRVYRESDHLQFITASFEQQYSLPKLVLETVDDLPSKFTKSIAYLDPTKISGKLQVRTWRHGDRISPVGLKDNFGHNGSKLISDVLSDAKVPIHIKNGQLVVHDDEKIVWCVGFAIGRDAIATERSEKIKVQVVFI